MKRTSFAKDKCPVARSIDIVGEWRSLLMVRDAFVGIRRFGEFQKSLGVAKNILIDRLRKLTSEGVLQIAAASDGSAYKEYILTEKGRGLLLIIVALGQWGEGGSCATFKLVERKKGKSVRLELRSEDGRRVELNDVQMVPGDEK